MLWFCFRAALALIFVVLWRKFVGSRTGLELTYFFRGVAVMGTATVGLGNSEFNADSTVVNVNIMSMVRKHLVPPLLRMTPNQR